MNETILKFGYPGRLVREYEHWVVLLRPKQVTLGSLVLAAKSEATSLPELPVAAFQELKVATRDIEFALAAGLGCERLNYLMLMMVDRHVHFHVVPRYSTSKSFAGVEFHDVGWPEHPDMLIVTDMSASASAELLQALKTAMPSAAK